MGGRPVSFYLLLSIPVVLVLSAHMFRFREEPRPFFALVFGLVVCLSRIGPVAGADGRVPHSADASDRSLPIPSGRRLGDEAFLAELGNRAKDGPKP